MAETKICPKCNGIMKQGRIQRLNEFAAGSKYLYLWAPDDEPKFDSKDRKGLAAFCCDQCGFTEFYGFAAE